MSLRNGPDVSVPMMLVLIEVPLCLRQARQRMQHRRLAPMEHWRLVDYPRPKLEREVPIRLLHVVDSPRRYLLSERQEPSV